MTKKLFVLILIIGITFFASSFVFGADEIKESLDKAGKNIGNVVGGAGNVVKDGAENVGNAVNGGMNNIKSQDGMGTTTNNRTTKGYTATRTATDGTFAGMNGTTWTWFILAIAAILIIALVWFYSAQKNDDDNYSTNDHQ